MRVLIAYNEPVLPADHPETDSECEIVDVVDAIAAHLDRPGWELTRQGVTRDWNAFRQSLASSRPDVIFNLFEGFGDDPASECRFAQQLEESGVAFTGSSSRTLWRAGRKDIAKGLFRQAGIATPAFRVVERLSMIECRLKWPLIVKPAFRDASVGIDQASVVTDRAQLEGLVARVASEYGFPVLVEEFIRGREISAAVIDAPALRVLPIVETLFASNDGAWPIDGYDAKWRPGSRDYEATDLRYPAELSPQLTERVSAMAREAYCLLGCRGLATIDFRLGADGTPYLLEVNPNSNLKPSVCFTKLLGSAGIGYTEFLVHTVLSAKARSHCA